MPTIKDLYPDKWLKAEHLRGTKPAVAIEKVSLEKLFNPNSRKEEPRLILKFHNKKLRLVLNKTQCFAIAAIAGDDYTRWPGHQIVLSPGIAPNGQPTILISPLPDVPPEEPPTEPEPSQEEQPAIEEPAA